MVSNISSTTPGPNLPAQHHDGTLSALIHDIELIPHAGTLIHLGLPLSYREGGGFGRFFLVRCVEDNLSARAAEWSIYARRALYAAAMPSAMPDQAGSRWSLWIPQVASKADAGYQWLLRRPVNSTLNLIGPLGQTFSLAAHSRSLLVLADLPTLPLTLPIIHQMLDQGGRVTLLLRGDTSTAQPLLSLIPIPVEVRIIPTTDWLTHLAEPVRWADQLCAALPNHEYAPLAHHIRTLRFQLDADFAHALVASDLVCGVGACLACVIPTRDGSYTRTCVHGPVFPLATLA